jgi:hypothetical protein
MGDGGAGSAGPCPRACTSSAPCRSAPPSGRTRAWPCSSRSVRSLEWERGGPGARPGPRPCRCRQSRGCEGPACSRAAILSGRTLTAGVPAGEHAVDPRQRHPAAARLRPPRAGHQAQGAPPARGPAPAYQPPARRPREGGRLQCGCQPARGACEAALLNAAGAVQACLTVNCVAPSSQSGGAIFLARVRRSSRSDVSADGQIAFLKD